VDVRGAMEDSDLPLTQQEYLEWGDPRVPEYAALMDSYCPYTNIAKGCVPLSILLTCRAPRPCRTHNCQQLATEHAGLCGVIWDCVCTGGLNDPRVPAWQCLRYLSRLRHSMDPDVAAHGGVTIVAAVDHDAGYGRCFWALCCRLWN
jgi:protease II